MKNREISKNLIYLSKFLYFYFFSSISNKELPNRPHLVPSDFVGINIASNDNEETDEYIFNKIQELSIKNLRIYFSYKDFNTHKQRIINKCKNFNGKLIVNLSVPPEEAHLISTESGLLVWKNFITKFFNEFRHIPFDIEIGSTINRKSWTNLPYKSFFRIWSVAYHIVKLNNRRIIGPNITDFEPHVNFGILAKLKNKHQLTDAQSNNLFAERTIEPEPFDHRVLSRFFSKILKIDLYKKSSIYKFISNNYEIKKIISSNAFWSIKRIGRLRDNPQDYQAKYLTRYFTMLAAKGDFDQIFWGPLICQREGLINDNTDESEYPELEQVTFYNQAKGYLSSYSHRPSFYACKFFNSLIPGSTFIKNYSSIPEIQILEFEKNDRVIHVIWTMNSHISDIFDFYLPTSIDRAEIKNYLGNNIESIQSITENPYFLIWHVQDRPTIIQKGKVISDLVVDPKLNYFHLHDPQWTGIIQADDKNTSDLIINHCHPSILSVPDQVSSLRKSRNAVWVKNIPGYGKVVIKKPLKIYAHKIFLNRNKPNKSMRSWNGAMSLLNKGLNTADPIALFSLKNDKSQLENYYISRYVEGFTFNDLAQHFFNQNIFHGFSKREIFEQCATFINKMHSRGIYFRDLSAGNIIIIISNRSFDFSLIDTGRIKDFNNRLSFQAKKTLRFADMVRLLNKFDWEVRNIFLKKYFQLNNRKLSIFNKFTFLKYDLHVSFKRFRKTLYKK